MCVRWKYSENVNTINMMYVVAISNKSQIQSIDFDDQINRTDCDGLCVRASERKNDVFAYVFGKMLAKRSTSQHLLWDLRVHGTPSRKSTETKSKQRATDQTNDVEHFEVVPWPDYWFLSDHIIVTITNAFFSILEIIYNALVIFTVFK